VLEVIEEGPLFVSIGGSIGGPDVVSLVEADADEEMHMKFPRVRVRPGEGFCEIRSRTNGTSPTYMSIALFVLHLYHILAAFKASF
jgi:hypothetical protein